MTTVTERQQPVPEPSVLRLPTDRVPTAERRRGTESLGFTLDPATARRLDEVSGAHGATRATTLLAVFQLVLGRYAGVRDVGVDVQAPSEDRSDAGTQVVRARWEDGQSFSDFLRQIRAFVPGAFESSDVPGTVPSFRTEDLSLTWEAEPAERSGPGALRATAEYDGDLLDRATVEQLATHYLTLLESALASPEARIADLAHTTPAERALLAAWGTEGGAAHAENVVAAFQTRAEATPDAVALVYGDETVSYARLRERAAHVAHLLTERGVGPESVVGLAMERSASLVVAMLGVLTAGAAHLPLDPGHPEARLAFMVEDSGACLVLADRDVDFTDGVPVLRADALPALRADLSRTTGEAPAIHPEQQACVLYTSGSTGRPKGVTITHRGIVRLACDTDYLGFGPSDVVAQVANTSFDAATWEVWGALLNGARLVGIRKDEALTPGLLRARVVEHGVTAMLLTTALFHRCVDAEPAMFASMRTLFFGGEAADAQRVAALRAAVPGLRLVNAYGPTEGTTIASTYDIVEPALDAARVPIGRPIADTRLHVLDPYGQESGIGVPGELYIGGAGLARGYVGRPDLTAERFVPSPFGVGERLYRTGDVVRWREDGALEYLGRADTQVKIRGVRIEPDEIAGVLSMHRDVRAAVVDVQGADGSERLVAYVVPRGERRATPRELRAYAASRLPEAMVPARYVTLPELPVTPNGKLDRRALPAPSDEDGVQAETYVAPRGATEELVARVWGELLGVPRMSAHDDFFALGGHSLLATQAVTRVAARLGVELGVRAVFEAPTVEGFAARAAAARRAGAHLPVAATGDGPHALSFAQQRLWFLDRLAPGSSLYNVPLVLTVDGPLDTAVLGDAVRALVRRHASLRTRLVAHGDEPVQVVDVDAELPLEVEDLRHLPEAEREDAADQRAQREAEQPFDLARAPLCRVRLLRLAEERHLLLLTMHHAVSDGWSVGVLIRDLGALYAAARGGAAPTLPPLPVQYADYADWQRRFLDSGVRDEQLTYWKDRLAGAPASLDLPTDRPRPPVPRNAGEVFPLRLTAELTERLGEVSRAHGVTRFMTLLAVFQLVLGRYAQARDVSVGTPVSGRTRPEFEELVGFFVNTLVLRTCWEDGLTFSEFLARVRETTLGAYEHQDVPFEQIVEAVRPPRDPSRTPLFQVMLAMQNAPAGTTALPGLTVSVHEGKVRAAKFDLTVAWEEASLDAGALCGSVEYDVDLFDRATVERMMRHYVTLLGSALAAPDARLSELEMIGAEELTDLVGPVAETPARPAATLHGLVDAAAARTPDRTALVQGDRSVGYAELRERSDAVCAYLRAHGVGAGDTVVVRMDRCLAWPAALLGVLKAGAAYVPADLATPPERLGHLLRDASAALVLGSRADGAPPDVAVPFAAVEDAFEAGTELPAGEHAVHPAATAYVLYTSGTTGRPKGVCVSHANLVHTLEAVAERYGLGAEDRVLQFASLTFDVAAEELFASLVRGATVVLLPTGPVPGIAELTSLARRERLSVLNLPGSYWHEWVSALDRHPPAACHALRLVIVGSERVDGGKLAEWQATAPAHIRLLNAYGPTETTITATVHEPSATAVSGRAPGGTVPIGRPLPGVRAYVLDAALRPVPRSVPGDLYLAGPGVSHGYLGDPGRTAGSFLPDPWGRPGERMYATRDRARRGADGELEFLGRTDDQIKLRGFRIELGEIEAALATHPEVRDAAAVLREDTPGRPELVGYVALAGATSEAELRAHLERRLPGYMVPTAIVTLDRLPRNERGKTDRRALPAPARPERSTAVPDAPMGEVERVVASIWREVLTAEHVGVDDNFFELGGHSLLVVRVQSRLTETLGTAVPVVDLFRYPTVRTLARHLAAGDGPTATAGDEGRRRAAARRQRQGARPTRARRQRT
ncbi:amino acid adenylation domain-containing protein [Streptomyces sp. NPDC048187]|uniref:amino acid adenylation domain-containing protein n=1 Tax=Streptomyces sp. NPDC048187 TaxID=3365509 RepID=UPI00371D6A69